MKILIAEKDKAFCLHLPLWLLCNRVGAALLAGGIQRAARLSDGSGEVSVQKGLITVGQLHGLLKTLRKSKRILKLAQLPLLDIEEKNGDRIMIVL